MASDGVEAIDTRNEFFVGARGDDSILILRAPAGPLSKAQALRLAAWLVALADDDPGAPVSEFSHVLAAVMAT